MESDADAETRRQNHRAQAEGTLWSRAGVDRKTVFVCSVHMPKRLAETPADQQSRSRLGRVRSNSCSRNSGQALRRFTKKHGLRATQGVAELDRWRQGGES